MFIVGALPLYKAGFEISSPPPHTHAHTHIHIHTHTHTHTQGGDSDLTHKKGAFVK